MLKSSAHPDVQGSIDRDLFGNSLAPEQFEIDRANGIITRTVSIGKFEGRTTIPCTIKKGVDDELEASSSFDKAWLRSTTRQNADISNSGLTVRTIDLFAGCGGLSVGIREAVSALGGKFSSVFASDIDEGALSVYSKNLSPKTVSQEPVEHLFQQKTEAPLSTSEHELKRKVGKVDFLVGGPPCQGHSDLNNHTRRNDPRNDLYGLMARAAAVLQPRFIIIENVLGVRHSSTGIVQTTVKHLHLLGYETASLMLNSAEFGVAQKRKRHFTLAMRSNAFRVNQTIESLRRPGRPVMWAIDDLIDEADSYSDPFRSAATHSAINQRRIEYLFENEMYELPDSERPDCHRLKPHAYNSVYGRMRAEAQAPTITSGFGSTGQGRFVHPYRKRTITPHEAARIQFFPDWFAFSEMGRRQLQKYIGNAVPPKLGYVLALSLLSSETSY